MLKLENKT
jgi:predicted amidohydrolase